MHANTRGELHEIPHRRIDKLRVNWGWHVHIGVRNYGPTPAVNDPPVDTGDVVQVLVCDMKRPRWRQVTGAAGADLGHHDRSIVIEQISFLLGEIELHRVLGDRNPGKACKNQKCGDKEFHLPEWR